MSSQKGEPGMSLKVDRTSESDCGNDTPESSYGRRWPLYETEDSPISGKRRMIMDDSGVITSFKDIDSDVSTEIGALPATRIEDSNASCNEASYSQADDVLYSEFTRKSSNLYAVEMEEESPLLDCDNFINFELDQNKTIVLNIKDAKDNSKSILQQHAITHPRSIDLPSCPF